MCIRALLIGLLSSLSAWIFPAAADPQLRFVVQDSQPKYFLNTDENAGLCGDIYIALREQLGAQGISVIIDNEYTPIKRILALVEYGKADAFCGAGRNAQRESRFIYSTDAIYSVSNVVAAHSSELVTPASLDDLASMQSPVGAFYGTSSARFLKARSGITVDDKFTSLDEALKTLAGQRRIRYFYYHDLGLYYLVKTSGLPLRVLGTKFRTTPQWMIYSKKMPVELRQRLDAEVSHMVKSGMIDRIWARYKPAAD
ncbi:substrate-binding periplasmic protein [Aestuariispira ectoiniformans]|uniref:substrate-binding periplasmic protein n=1 Tax=Aestuariispira ectoiniformans TaxID=2775080 RepID=UPI00223ABEFC|nr:transporter substrate-binding domain-containing protein [Aestuariispira ectoiniformans]